MSSLFSPPGRRLISALLSVVMAGSAMLAAMAPVPAFARGRVAGQPAATPGGHISKDLRDELQRPGPSGRWNWARDSARGVRMAQVIVTSDADDSQMAALQSDIRRLGGMVQVVHPAVKSLTVALPMSAVERLARLPDVVSVAPNRSTAGALSTVETIAGATTAAVRPYSSATAYSGLDGSGVGIAILDSGVMKAHRSFQNAAGATRVKRSVSMLKANAANWSDAWDSLALSPPPGSLALAGYEAAIAADNDPQQDPYGHGTHVASVAAGRAFYQSPDSTGLAPNANLYDVRVLDASGAGTLSDALEGINWVMYHAREYNIRVMNLSLAAASTDSWDVDPLCNAVRAATAMGITVVVAAGNFGLGSQGQKVYGTISSPAHDPTVITVGAVNFKASNGRGDDVVTNFSSRGPTRSYLDMGTWKWYDNIIKPDLVAPGNKLVGANATSSSPQLPVKSTLATSYPALVSAAGGPATYAQGLIQLSGTSVAAPAVAGAVAVLLQANPGLTPPLVKAILQYTAQPLAGQNLAEQGAGQLNLEGAVRLAQSLRTDISSAVLAGAMLPGVTSMLAAGKTLPTSRSSTVAGTPFNWSRIVMVGGSHVASGDKLFNTYQSIWDPRLAWASDFAMWTTPVYWSGTGIPANTFPQRFNTSYLASMPLLGAGVMLADSLLGISSSIGKTGLFTLTPTLSAWLVSGSGVMLASGIVLSEGLVLSEGIVLSEGLVLSEGIVLSEGLVLSEGIVLSEGVVLSESINGSAGFNTTGSIWGE